MVFMVYRKYRAIRTVVDGITFASQAEAARYGVLKIMQMAGEISELKCQPKYPIVVNGEKICDYIGDFLYVRNGNQVCEDVKGVRLPIYKLKCRLMKAVHGIVIQEVR